MKKLILVVCTLVLLSILIISCNNLFASDDDPRILSTGYTTTNGASSGYKILTWKNELGQFSFEYKSNYKIDKNNTYIFTTHKSCEVSLIGDNDTRIDISVFPNTEFVPSF